MVVSTGRTIFNGFTKQLTVCFPSFIDLTTTVPYLSGKARLQAFQPTKIINQCYITSYEPSNHAPS